MAKRRHKDIKKIIERRKKEGRGQGRGDNYKPWIYTQDFASRGIDHRKNPLLYKRKTPIHALSDLESNFIDIMHWANEQVIEIREQYPLSLEETVAIADELNIKHPSQHGVDVPLTTDVLVTLRKGLITEEQPWTLKYVKDLEDPKGGRRTFEKFEIERVYWLRQGKKLLIATEREIPKVAVKNINHFNTYRSIANRGVTPQEISLIVEALTDVVLSSDEPLITITDDIDAAYGLPERTAITIAQHLIATRQWRINIFLPFEPHNRLILLQTSLVPTQAEAVK